MKINYGETVGKIDQYYHIYMIYLRTIQAKFQLPRSANQFAVGFLKNFKPTSSTEGFKMKLLRFDSNKNSVNISGTRNFAWKVLRWTWIFLAPTLRILSKPDYAIFVSIRQIQDHHLRQTYLDFGPLCSDVAGVKKYSPSPNNI